MPRASRPQLGRAVEGLAGARGEKRRAETPFARRPRWTPACQGLNAFPVFLLAVPPALDPLGVPSVPPWGRLAAPGAGGASRALGSQFCSNELLAAY